MIKNTVRFITNSELNKLHFTEDTWVATLEGKGIRSEEQLLLALKNNFHLPDYHNWDAVLDWLTDLNWLDKESFALIIKDYEFLLKYRLDLKEKFMTYLTEDVLQFWEEDIKNCVVDGHPKSFQVYIVS